MLADKISLSAGIRHNLFHLQASAKLSDVSRQRLATGKRINSALDDPVNFFAALGHVQRALDLTFRKDHMRESIKIIETATNGIEAIYTLVDQAKSLTHSALSTNSGEERDHLAAQFDETLAQIDMIVDDSNYLGINLLRGSDENIEVNFDRKSDSKLTLTGFDATYTGLGIKTIDENLDTGDTGHSESIIMQGSYIRTAVSNDGSLGFGNTTAPGIKHDPTGTGTFGVADYLTPGTAWEVFAVESGETGLKVNNNTGGGGGISSSGVTDLRSTSVYDNHLRWEGYVAGAYRISTDYFFNDGDEYIGMRTTIMATSDLTELTFLRAIDPDPDSYAPHNSHNTLNSRGLDVNMNGDFTDPGDIASENWVLSQGAVTGVSLGLYSDSPHVHNTGITGPWSNQPSDYLAGTDVGDGDNAIGIAFDLGDLNAGESISMTYSYVVSDSINKANPAVAPGRWSSNLDVQKAVDQLETALSTLRSQSEILTASLNIITFRINFTQDMVDTLSEGAASLTNADLNEEGANMLMLQIRQELGNTSLSLASQAVQSVLTLF